MAERDESPMVDDEEVSEQKAAELKQQMEILRSIPGFTMEVKRKPETKILEPETLTGLIEKAKLEFPKYKFAKADIDLRNKKRETIAPQIMKLEIFYQKRKRELTQMKSMLDETEETDKNIDALRAEKETTEKVMDPVAARQKNREIRERNRIERDAAAEEAQILIANENALAGLTCKRRKRVIDEDDQPEDDQPEADDDNDGAEDEVLRRRLEALKS